ncbi:general stress protein [Staphylococcus simulans]|uniref:general stress protein n=1 Tax=Staphylococcus simulans TaxID=1286 RepID=UPI003999EFBF
MANITVLTSQDEIFDTLKQKLDEGYNKDEISVISKNKLNLGSVSSTDMTVQSTSGTFSDRVARLLTGEDGEEAVLLQYDLSDTERQILKRELINGNIVVLADKSDFRHDSDRQEFKDEYEEKKDKHDKEYEI